jgi:hypothetical protein
MGIVLSDWVAQGKLRPVYILRPVLSTPSSIDPALVVLGLDDEDAVGRYDDVVDLRGSTSLPEEYVIKRKVALREGR